MYGTVVTSVLKKMIFEEGERTKYYVTTKKKTNFMEMNFLKSIIEPILI